MQKATILLFGLLLIFSGCGDSPSNYTDPRGADYAGSESCIQCHKDISHSYTQTAHYKATAPATPENVLGDFTTGRNEFLYEDHTKLVMERRNDSLYQVHYKDGKEVKAYRFDIVFGSENAQTAVYWNNNNTFEMPISYYKAVHNWATSPGFSTAKPYFERQAIKDCFACHSSNVSNKAYDKSSDASHFMAMEVEDVMNKSTIIYGIDCERCHGPAKKHVDFHLKFPEIKAANEIVSFNKLTNQQKLDACSICHSGVAGLKIKSRFQFKPGDNLSDYYRTPQDSDGDVHGNQAGLLSQSKCFIKSQTMNCLTCHNPHENAAKNVAAYSKMCMSCHEKPKHIPKTIQSIAVSGMQNNCIDCHMPNQSSKAITFKMSNNPKQFDYNLRTHKIGVYPLK